ncbi:tetratricopeptide repeat protein 19, mitochondrial isoform X3 [Oryctolagus cuniculus]|uniref:tetratricopeptide repeat protein 19, mitochondrial isoform X3 n=1 Tax=Oryctolagus cuniculus TaxID=9986 RepID=UPI0022313395|nr:tetratricopeptide repeat protein 19, mitochondrial isoform X3 [Oryctolagus cuniculus]
MYRLLSRTLGRGLLRAAGRRCRAGFPRLLPGPAGGAGPGVPAAPSRAAPPHGGGPGLLPLLAALSWFSRSSEPEEQEQQQRGADGAAAAEDAADEAEAEIIRLLKRAKLSIMKDEPEEAEKMLHDALRLAYQSDNKKAITYTYDLMANLAFIRGQLENAEQLFKATMSYLLGGGMKQEDNAIIEISLKLASIYAAQNKQEFALAGYEFCISTLEDKIEKEKELAEDIMSGLRSCASVLPGRAPGAAWPCEPVQPVLARGPCFCPLGTAIRLSSCFSLSHSSSLRSVFRSVSWEFFQLVFHITDLLSSEVSSMLFFFC